MWKSANPISVFLFCDSSCLLLPFIMKDFSGGSNIQEKSCSAISGLVHVPQLRVHLLVESLF